MLEVHSLLIFSADNSSTIEHILHVSQKINFSLIEIKVTLLSVSLPTFNDKSFARSAAHEYQVV
jgi:hypothetical protein